MKTENTPLEKLTQAAENYANEQLGVNINLLYPKSDETLFEACTTDFISAATSEAAREYWSSDAIAFAEWTNKNQFIWINSEWVSHKIEHSGCIYSPEELYKEFLKEKQK